MTKDDIIRMARETGVGIMSDTWKSFIVFNTTGLKELERFFHAAYAAGAAAEREACAKVCEVMAKKNNTEHHLFPGQIDRGVRLAKAVGLVEGAAAIRARSQQ